MQGVEPASGVRVGAYRISGLSSHANIFLWDTRLSNIVAYHLLCDLSDNLSHTHAGRIETIRVLPAIRSTRPIFFGFW